MGNVTRDPQVKYTPGGTAVCEVGLAINKTWFDKQANQKKEEVTFVDVTLWGRTAEVACEYCRKGGSVMIEGELKMDSWVDKESGQKRSKLKVNGHRLQLLGGRRPDDQTPPNAESYGEEPQAASTAGKKADVFDGEDVPF